MNYQNTNPYNHPTQYSNQHPPPPQQQQQDQSYYSSHASSQQPPATFRPNGTGGGGGVRQSQPYPPHGAPSHASQQGQPPQPTDNNNTPQQQQQESNPYEGGIFPPILLQSLDQLVDRLNISSGYYPRPKLSTINTTNNNNTSSNTNDTSNAAMNIPCETSHTAPVQALLVGTNEGICLSRSFGTTLFHSPTSTTTTNNTTANSRITPLQHHSLSEEVLHSLETIWSTLPSASPPHAIMDAIVTSVAKAATINTTSTTTASNGGGKEKEVDWLEQQPPHPFLAQLGLGRNIKVATAFYEDWTVLHLHLAPLVVTILTTPNANIGSIKSIAISTLTSLLYPIRHAIMTLRSQTARLAMMDAGIAPLSTTNNSSTAATTATTTVAMSANGSGGVMNQANNNMGQMGLMNTSQYPQQHQQQQQQGTMGQPPQQQTFSHQDLGIVYGSTNPVGSAYGY